MGYQLEWDETISEGVRRIASEQLDNAFDALHDAGSTGVEEAVHDVRKRCKKLRGLVRLVRPAMGSHYRNANVMFRDAARELSSIRDAHALLATFDDLVAGTVAHIPADGIAGVRQGLSDRAAAASQAVQGAGDGRIVRACELLEAARDDIDDWPLADDIAVVVGGAEKTYKRGRERFSECVSAPSSEQLHQWRKRVKYSWYHIRLLHEAAPSVLDPLASRLHDLSDALGDDHDLAVLSAQLQAEPTAFGGEQQVRDALVIIDGRRGDLQRRAISLGARLYVESPSAFADRLSGYWSAWRRHGAELPTGEIADVTRRRDALEDLPKAVLYDKAQKLGLEGRSRMSRLELVAALRASGGVEG